MTVQDSEKAQVAAAYQTLQRVRKIRIKFMAAWTRLDDLEDGAEQDLRQRLQEAWDGWAARYSITTGEVRGPEVITHKLDYVPTVDGEIPEPIAQ